MPDIHELSATMDQVWVINLPQREDRWRQFTGSLPYDWPFRTPERFEGVDGRNLPEPQWWRAGPGGWGCFRSHYQIIEDALRRKIESVFVLEDDAIFVHEFARRVGEFFAELPADWDWIYLGGQHLEQEWGLPTRVSERVYRPYNVHRAHAYAIRGRKTLEYVYRHLNTPAAWGAGDHLDHRLGELHKNFPGHVYVPDRWLVGQRSGLSSIKDCELDTCFFEDAVSLVDRPLSTPVLAVVGADDQARDFVARTLHELGVPMGEGSIGTDPDGDFAGAVAPGLDEICQSFFSKDGLPVASLRFQVSKLRWWANRREQIHGGQIALLGGTHRLLPLMPEAILQGWNRPRVVRVLSDTPATTHDSSLIHQRIARGMAHIHTFAPMQVYDVQVDAGTTREMLCRQLREHSGLL